jgi:hypothetical protein
VTVKPTGGKAAIAVINADALTPMVYKEGSWMGHRPLDLSG